MLGQNCNRAELRQCPIRWSNCGAFVVVGREHFLRDRIGLILLVVLKVALMPVEVEMERGGGWFAEVVPDNAMAAVEDRGPYFPTRGDGNIVRFATPFGAPAL
jgi:hypothetical protein